MSDPWKDDGPGIADLSEVVEEMKAGFAKPCGCGHTEKQHPNYVLYAGLVLQPCVVEGCTCADLERA